MLKLLHQGLARIRRPRDREEFVILGSGVLLLALLWLFVLLAGEVVEGDTHHFDQRILNALRQDDDRAALRGPWWLRWMAQDITALGSMTVLGLTVLGATGYLLLSRMYRTGLFVFVAGTGGWLLNWTLKTAFDRARPDVVPHLREVMSSSFPSGHALTSAAVYLTLGALLMRVAEGRVARYYCMAVAAFVTFLVGSSRVLLGVHYPTDVLGGWLVGMSWALLCWSVGRVLERRAGLAREKRLHGEAA